MRIIDNLTTEIKALVKDKVTYSDDNGILKVAQDFYSKLFTSKNPSYDDINTYLNSVDLPALSEDKQDICEGLISMKECEAAINKIKLHKSPGEDGIPIEFYKTFWKQLGSFLVEMYNDSFEKKRNTTINAEICDDFNP